MSKKTKGLLCFFILLLFPMVLWVIPSNKISAPLELGVGGEEQGKPLKVEGKFPDWLEGVLVRNSSIPVYQEGKQISHEFDGLAMLHSFAFNQGKVFYTNRFLESQAHDAVVNKGSGEYAGFASEPSFWQKVQDFFNFSDQWVNNASVNVFKYGNNYVALTEVPLPARFDLKTLKTLGSFHYQDDLPKSKSWESAHPHLDSSSNEIVNFLIEFGRQSYYVLYRMKQGSSSREVIAKVPVENPAYMHSFAMTEHYLILTEFPLVVRPLDLLLSGKPFIHNFTWQPEKGTRFLVVERSSGKVTSQLVTEPFFSFHHANAYETEKGEEIVIDIVASPDISAMPTLFPQASSLPVKQSNWQRRLMRYHLLLNQEKMTAEVLLEKKVEFPRLDDRLDGKSYRYLYMTLSEDSGNEFLKKASTGLGKLDLVTREFKTWDPAGYQAIEPIFVAAPHAKNEDEGLVLTVIYNEENKSSFLLALDGQTFTEVARAELPWHIPGSFHGQYFSESIFLHSQ